MGIPANSLFWKSVQYLSSIPDKGPTSVLFHIEEAKNPPYDCFQPTMSRWENASDLRSVIRLGRVMLDLWLASYPAPDAHLNRIWLSSGLSEAQESPGRQ